MPTVYEIIISLTALAICTITDLQNRTICPAVPLTLLVLGMFAPNKDFAESVYCLLLGFLPIFIVNRFGKGGDGDALVCGALGFSMTINFGAWVFLSACMLYFVVLLIVDIIKRNTKIQLPYMPFLTIAYIIILISCMSGGIQL